LQPLDHFHRKEKLDVTKTCVSEHQAPDCLRQTGHPGFEKFKGMLVTE